MPQWAVRPPVVPVLAACVALAAVSLLLPFAPLFDPWAWLVWGRELGALELDTSAGPSWKPLPALIGAALAPAGVDVAPELWLLVARAAWLAVPVLAWRLAARVEGSGGGRAVAAGALAAIAVLLVHDGFTSTFRQMSGGLSEPLLAALTLGAIEAAIARRPRLALGLALLACLLRPEAWPFAAAYAGWEVRAGGVRARAAVAGAATVALLWLGPDLLGAGDPLTGAERARGAIGSPPLEAMEALGRAAVLPLAVTWLGLAALAVTRDRPRWVSAVAIGALAWIALVAAMAAGGYAGLPRFMLPAAVAICSLGAAGLMALLASRRLGPILVAALALALAGDAAWRIAAVPGEVERAQREAESLERLRALADARREPLRACAPLATTDFLTQPPLAWELGLPLSRVDVAGRYPRGGTLVTGPGAPRGLRTRASLDAGLLGSSGEWAAFRVGPCAPAQPASGALIAGVSGARR